MQIFPFQESLVGTGEFLFCTFLCSDVYLYMVGAAGTPLSNYPPEGALGFMSQSLSPEQVSKWKLEVSQFLSLSLFFFFFFFVFLGHMEVPRLGVESELYLLAYARATATPDPSMSVTYTTGHGNSGSLTH